MNRQVRKRSAAARAPDAAVPRRRKLLVPAMLALAAGIWFVVEHFELTPDDGTPEATRALITRAEFAFQKGWAADAERLYLRVVELEPGNITAHERLLFIYASQGRMWEVKQHVLPLLKSEHVDLNYLVASSSSKKLMDANLPFVRQCLAARPDDPLPRLIEAKWAIHDKELRKAREILSQIVRKYPLVVDAHRGDGTFADVTDACGVIAPEGRGLRIVAADFDGSQRLSLFVASDMSANFFLHNQTPSPGGEPAFVERAILNGLVYNANGVSQALMGIAADDANQDGLIDLFVTNFYREANAFYMQLPDGSFRDEIAASGLQQATFPVLGWGTQFVDAELDGIPDLLVTNGSATRRPRKDIGSR